MRSWRIAGLGVAIALAVLLFALRRRTSPSVTPAKPAPVVAASRAPEVVDDPPETRPELEEMPTLPPGVELDEHGVPKQDFTVLDLGPGDGTGVYAFPKPGTKPIKRGIVVPEGYVLPPGYLRHHQTTDDGDEVPPILVFDPTSPPPGVTVPPGDPVVPPELAPKGMPIQLLDPPPVRASLDEHGQPIR